MIRLSGVTKTFDGFTALDGLDMHVPEGSVYGLVGPNGAGKSTVIRHITGALRPDAGEILVAGEPVWENTAVKARMALIPDEIFYFTQSNMNDMKKFYQSLYPGFDAELFTKIAGCFPELNTKKNIRSFSKGMQKQAAFALSLAAKPDVLVLDEPVDGLAPVIRRQVWSLMLSEVAESGMTVLVSSHNLRELEDVCDHVGIMNRGKIMLERSLSDLQGSVSKFQIAFSSAPESGTVWPEGLDILHESGQGRVTTLIIRGDQSEVEAKLAALGPVILDVIPLTLEEIFIYEMGGAGYEVKDILL